MVGMVSYLNLKYRYLLLLTMAKSNKWSFPRPPQICTLHAVPKCSPVDEMVSVSFCGAGQVSEVLGSQHILSNF